ncbi:MAG: PD40 domain-containing protein, partial [Bacteroidales bacterium]|nr:PD40 domain-containing protein [Bacteroidales bacterium]
MKKSTILVAIFMIMCIPAKHSPAQAQTSKGQDLITRNNRPAPDFSKGVLNEQILWYFGRVSAPEISPDGSNMLYGVTYYDYQKNKGNTELYVQPGTTPIQITTTPSSEVQAVWRPDGKKIGFLFVADGTMQVFECNPDGTGRTQLTHAESDINGFSYSPDGKHILYTRNVQLDPTITDRYADLPQANAMIYDDLMYRHWDSWA